MTARGEVLRSRLRIVEAARDAFADTGFDASSMKDVASRAGLSVDVVCRYFPTREHLALAIYGELGEALLARAAELSPGSVAERFTALMELRIAQCEQHRRPLTALLGHALDPQSSLYVLGEAAEGARAKVQAALGAVVAGAKDAPRKGGAVAEDVQVLYTLHLGIVLATLSRPDASWARAMLAPMQKAVSWASSPLVRPLVRKRLAPLLLTRARAVDTRSDVGIAREILRRVFANNRVLPGVTAGLTPASEAMHLPLVLRFLRAKAPLHFVLPAFPAKAPNPRKVLGPLPDLGEARALSRLTELLDSVSEVWEPGARLTICSDGHVFADAVGVSDADVDRYRDALVPLISDERIEWFELATAFADATPAALRAELMQKYAEPLADLKARAKALPSLGAQLDGIHRFLYEDELVRAPELSKSQAKKKTRDMAYEVVRRSEAWGALVSRVFPDALRLSIHPQPDPSAKIGVNLLGTGDAWLTPWHATAVVTRAGTSLMHRADAEARGAVVVMSEGRPSHMELP